MGTALKHMGLADESSCCYGIVHANWSRGAPPARCAECPSITKSWHASCCLYSQLYVLPLAGGSHPWEWQPDEISTPFLKAMRSCDGRCPDEEALQRAGELTH